MQITLDSSEIKQAIVSFVRDQGIDLTNTDVEVGMTAGRGVNGTTATVDIIPKRSTGATGVKTTFHNVTNLTPGQTPRGTVSIASVDTEEEALDEEITDSVEDEETEEEELEDSPVAATNSIFN